MKSVENNVEHLLSVSVRACLEKQNAIVRAGGYWNCLVAAREISSLLLCEGRSPWIARLRKTEKFKGHVFHAPLSPRPLGIAATWTTHYISCCDGMAYDPVAGRPIKLETYSMEVFGEHIAAEVFVQADELPVYLAGNRLL
jgi:hypothetical protein